MRQIYSPLDGFRSPFGRLMGSTAPFSPAVLFGASEPGVWYDPSDLTTLFQDTAGTTPVTTPGQTVALALDKSKGGLVSLGTTGWTFEGGTGAYSIVGNVITVTSVSANLFIGIPVPEWAIGDYAEIEITATSLVGTNLIYVGGVPQTVTSGAKRYANIIASNNVCRFVFTPGASGTFTVTSRKKTPGNHATQATLASRPTYGIVPLGGRRNLLTRTEEFENVYWVKTGLQAFGSGSTANATTAPDGTLTADFICENTASGNHRTNSPGISYVAGTSLTATVRVKSTTRNYSPYIGNASGAVTATFNLSNGTISVAASNVGDASGATASITQDAQGFWLCTLSGVVSASSSTDATIFHQIVNGTSASYTGDGTSGIFLWGAQLETGSSATAYQRVGSAFDVTEAGVASLSYLFFGGDTAPADPRWMVTPTITPGIDRAQVFAGVRKLNDTVSIISETSTNADGNAGSFYFVSGLNNGAIGNVNGYTSKSRGSTGGLAAQVQVNAPDTAVLAITHDIAGDLSTMRRNAVAGTNSTSDQGTGNYLAYPLYIGRRNGATLGFNGQIFSLIVRFGTNLDAGTITSTETWVAGKTGVTL